MPKEPVISIQEVARNCAVGVNQRRKPVSGAIRQALTPDRRTARAPPAGPEKLVASEKATQPATASSMKLMITRLGPCRSSQRAQRQLGRGETEEIAACQQAKIAAH